MYNVTVQGQHKPRAISGEPMRHKLSGELVFRVKTTINNCFQRFAYGEAHLGPFRVMIHTNVVCAHQQRTETLGGDGVAIRIITMTRKHFYKSITNDFII